MLIFVVLAIFAIAAMITFDFWMGEPLCPTAAQRRLLRMPGHWLVHSGFAMAIPMVKLLRPTMHRMKNGATSVNVSIVDSVVYVEATVESESFLPKSLAWTL